MRTDPSLRLFAHHAARPEAELDLARAALVLAEAEYPGLDVARYLDQLDDLGRLARTRVTRGGDVSDVERLLHLIYVELGFSGNIEDYYDPRNSFLNDVLDRRLGIPLTLALVVMEVARRAGLTVHGIGFPGHFLLRFDHDGDTFLVDPFEGCLLDNETLAELAARHNGRARVPDAHTLEPASKLNTLIRMLNNLRGIYATQEDDVRLRGVLERLEVLAPSRELRRQIEALGGNQPPPPRSRPAPVH